MDEAELAKAFKALDLPNFAYLTYALMLGLGMHVGYLLREMDEENPQSEN